MSIEAILKLYNFMATSNIKQIYDHLSIRPSSSGLEHDTELNFNEHLDTFRIQILFQKKIVSSNQVLNVLTSTSVQC